MADGRFYTLAGPFTLATLAEKAGAELYNAKDANKTISRVSPLQTADQECLSFLDNPKYVEAFSGTNAGACVIHPKLVDRAPKNTALLLSENPYYAYAIMAAMFYETDPLPKKTEIAPSAIIDPSAKIGDRCRIEAGSVIGARVEIGHGTHIYPNVVIASGVMIGEQCIIHAGVNISHTIIGHNVLIHQGACLGQDGFGFATDDQGNHTKVPQVGRVVIEDDVEIGAATCIDRGSGHDTIIGQGTKIDNLVQIGHNVTIGRNCIIVAQVGISGSTRIGDYVMFGGQSGITGHLRIGDGAKIAAQSGVMRDVPPGMTVIGSPAIPAQQHHRQTVTLKKLVEERREQYDSY